MVLDFAELTGAVARNPQWLALLEEDGGVRTIGRRPMPPSIPKATSL
jgi:hypothetical protein